MGKLIYSMLTSLDGYTSDARGEFDWAVPDAETHRFINDRTRSVSTYLYGRRMYETMAYWETAHLEPDQPYLTSVAVGGGTRFLPDGLRLDLDLLEERRLGGGISFLRYRVLPG